MVSKFSFWSAVRLNSVSSSAKFMFILSTTPSISASTFESDLPKVLSVKSLPNVASEAPSKNNETLDLYMLAGSIFNK